MDKSGVATAAAAQRKVPFEDTSGAAAAAQRNIDREAYDALSQASKEFNQAKLVSIN